MPKRMVLAVESNSPGTARMPNAAELKMASFTAMTPRWPARYNCPITGEMIVEKPKIVRTKPLPATLATMAKSARRPERPSARYIPRAIAPRMPSIKPKMLHEVASGAEVPGVSLEVGVRVGLVGERADEGQDPVDGQQD